MKDVTLLEKLAKKGYVMVPSDQGWCIKEIDGPIKSPHFNIMQECLDFAKQFFSQVNRQLISWSAIVRFNRGLGVEYYSLKTVDAYDPKEAHRLAMQEAEAMVGTSAYEKMVIDEVIVRPQRSL